MIVGRHFVDDARQFDFSLHFCQIAIPLPAFQDAQTTMQNFNQTLVPETNKMRKYDDGKL